MRKKQEGNDTTLPFMTCSPISTLLCSLEILLGSVCTQSEGLNARARVCVCNICESVHVKCSEYLKKRYLLMKNNYFLFKFISQLMQLCHLPGLASNEDKKMLVT